MRLAFEVSASCQRTVPVSSRKFAFRPKEVHDREDAIANTRDACAPQMRDHRSQLQPLTDHFSLITGTLASRPRRWRWARPWRRLKPRGRRLPGSRCRSGRSCGSCCRRSCYRSSSCSRRCRSRGSRSSRRSCSCRSRCWRGCRCRRRRASSGGKHSHVINVLFVTAYRIGIHVKGRGICHVPSSRV